MLKLVVVSLLAACVADARFNIRSGFRDDNCDESIDWDNEFLNTVVIQDTEHTTIRAVTKHQNARLTSTYFSNEKHKYYCTPRGLEKVKSILTEASQPEMQYVRVDVAKVDQSKMKSLYDELTEDAHRLEQFADYMKVLADVLVLSGSEGVRFWTTKGGAVVTNDFKTFYNVKYKLVKNFFEELMKFETSTTFVVWQGGGFINTEETRTLHRLISKLVLQRMKWSFLSSQSTSILSRRDQTVGSSIGRSMSTYTRTLDRLIKRALGPIKESKSSSQSTSLGSYFGRR